MSESTTVIILSNKKQILLNPIHSKEKRRKKH